MKKTRADYRRELVQAAESAAVRILLDSPIGGCFPQVETVKLMRQAWLEGHKAAKEQK